MMRRDCRRQEMFRISKNIFDGGYSYNYQVHTIQANVILMRHLIVCYLPIYWIDLIYARLHNSSTHACMDTY